jgi:hypothetical protein
MASAKGASHVISEANRRCPRGTVAKPQASYYQLNEPCMFPFQVTHPAARASTAMVSANVRKDSVYTHDQGRNTEQPRRGYSRVSGCGMTGYAVMSLCTAVFFLPPL